MRKINLALAVVVIGLAAACSPTTYKDINYMQDITEDTTMALKSGEGIIVQPQDMISIVVSCREPALAAMFNLTNVSYQAGSQASLNSGYQRLMGYTVDTDGNIDFPIVGKIYVAGLNRWGVAQKVKNELIDRNLLKDPVVTVEFMNFKVSVIGEVARPGTFSITNDRINLFEALSLAGDLTIYGRRNNVQVTRETDGKRHVYVLDLRSSDIFNSPAYYLQQNDIVYVEPNSVRAGQSTINENYFKSGSFWVSAGSLAITVTNLVVTLMRNRDRQ